MQGIERVGVAIRKHGGGGGVSIGGASTVYSKSRQCKGATSEVHQNSSMQSPL